MKWNLILTLFLAAFFLGCASGNIDSASARHGEDPETIAILDEALEDLGNESYSAASQKLERLVKEHPVSELDLVILYNSGAAQEGLKNCDLAAKRYASAARIANEKFDKIAAISFFRLGFAYDCMGKPKESILAFLDARKRSRSLPPDVASAELPARLAAGYASLNRRKEALYYFNEASAGLKRLISRSKSSANDQELAATTMYAMGKISQTSDPLTFVRMLTMQQPFLLQAVELAAGEATQKARRELLSAYQSILEQKFSSKAAEREFYMEGLKAARQLQKIRLPSANARTQNIFKLVARVESTLQTRLTKLAETLPKTPQEEKRQSLKKEAK